MRELYVFTGGYTEPIAMASGETVPGRCRGIGCYRMNPETGTLTELAVSPSVPNPSSVCADPAGPWLYAVSERKESSGIPGSTVSAYAIDPETGRLTLLGSQATTGADACYVTLSPDSRWLLAANYSGGSVCVFPILPDHSLGGASCILRHRGYGINPARQESPHPHQTVVSPDGKWVYVPDLGLDRLACYEADWERGWLLPDRRPDVAGLPGQGTRHCVFGPRGDRLYVVTEMTAEVNVYAFDPDSGRTELLQTVSARLPDWDGGFLGAAIRLHPNGRLLYCSVRGSNHLAAFRIEGDGRLTLLGLTPSGGEIPRDFVLTPDGRWLLAGHQDSHTICVFAVDGENGTLRQVFTQPDAGSVTTLSLWERNN